MNEQYLPVTEETRSLKEAKRKENRIGVVVLILLFGLFWVFQLLGLW